MEYFGPDGLGVMFGGEQGGGGFYDDTWFYDQAEAAGTRWDQCDPAECPDPADCTTSSTPCDRSGHRVARFVAGPDHRIIMFGGFRSGGSELLNDTWSWKGSATGWVRCTTECATGDTPALRCCGGLAFDSQSDKVVLFGGGYRQPGGGFAPYGDLWVWDLQGTPGWKCVSPTCSE